MAVRAHFPGYGLTRIFGNAAVRMGVYTGVGLAIGFTAWLLVANRMPAFENIALERNIVAATALLLVAMLPILRFLRSPGHLLASSLLGWAILTITYIGLSMHFHGLTERYTAPQVFILGSVVYMIVATLSWIGSCILRVRASHFSHSNHHLS